MLDWRHFMQRSLLLFAAGMMMLASVASAQQAPTAGPYKVLKTARVGGEGGWDYIYADTAARRLYIPRGAVREAAATDTTPAVAAVDKRTTIFNLDTLEPVGIVSGVGGNGAAVCPKTGHGFTSDHPAPAMFDVQTMTLMKNIEVPPPAAPDAPRWSADGIYCDTFNDRV